MRKYQALNENILVMLYLLELEKTIPIYHCTKKMKFSIKYFFSTCDLSNLGN